MIYRDMLYNYRRAAGQACILASRAQCAHAASVRGKFSPTLTRAMQIPLICPGTWLPLGTPAPSSPSEKLRRVGCFFSALLEGENALEAAGAAYGKPFGACQGGIPTKPDVLGLAAHIMVRSGLDWGS